MDTIKTRGIIARRADYGESNAMLTVFSRELGVISVCAYGVRSGKSKLKAATQMFCLGDFVLNKKNGDIYRVESVEIVESFYPLCEDFEKLSLANYLMDLCMDVYSDSDANVMSLLLNTLYVLAYRDTDPDLIKSVFELKLAGLSGYAPGLSGCMVCGERNVTRFDFSGGTVCDLCKAGDTTALLPGTLHAMRYILASDEKKLFAFEVTDIIKNQLAYICEKYLTEKTEKNYRSLEYYKKIKRK